MWIITDPDGKVIDKASKKESLSRGFILSDAKDEADLVKKGYFLIEITEKIDIRIEDTYKDSTLTTNDKYRATVELPGVESEIVDLSLKSDKATELGFTDLKLVYDSEISAKQTKREALLVTING